MNAKIAVLVLGCCIWLIQPCSGQNQQEIDSLLNDLKNAKEDTSKVNTLNALGDEMLYINPDTSIILANQALTLSKKLTSKKHIADSYHLIARVNSHNGDYPLSLENNFKALSLRKELADKSGIANSLCSIGSYYSDQGEYPKALEYLFMSLKMHEELRNKIGIARSLFHIGHFYLDQRDYPKALDYYFKALKISEELANKLGIAATLISIGIVYDHQKEYSKALDYYFKALKMAEQRGTKYGISITLGNIGLVYDHQKDYSKALDYYFKALKMSEQLGNIYEIAYTFGSIGGVYTETGKFVEAEENLKKAIVIFDSLGTMDDVRRIEESLSHLYDTTGRYKLALEHYKKAMVLKDTLFNQEKNEEITRKEMNYEFEKTQAIEKAGHEKQLAVADVEIKKQKQLKYSFIGGFTLVIILLLFVYRAYQAKQVLRLQEIRNKISGDLHDDIGSTLNSISVYSEVARKKDEQQDEALEMIGDASRKIIEAMSDIVWTINPDNDSFAKIIFRMKSLAYNLFRAKQIEFSFQVDEKVNEKKLSLEDRRNFYLLFKEAINNLVKYSNATQAAITLTNESDLIRLLIRDNGVGFDTLQDNIGNGLKNMKRRADEMNALLKIESSKGAGTQIELVLKA